MKHILLILMVLLLCVPAYGANHYVREGASGNNDGTDWTNAWTSLPSTLTRGDTYYIADGTYGSYTFDDAESSTSVITIKKATEASHGTETGWDSGYGDGQAVFSTTGNWTLQFQRDYYIFDGQVASDPADSATYGFKVVAVTPTYGYGIGFRVNKVEHTTIAYTAIPGVGLTAFLAGGFSEVRNLYVQAGCDSCTISHNYFYGCNVSIHLNGASNTIIEDNYFAGNFHHASAHGEEILIAGGTTVKNIVIHSNRFADPRMYVIGGLPGGTASYSDSVYFYNNLVTAGPINSGLMSHLMGSAESGTADVVRNWFQAHNTVIGLDTSTRGLLYTGSLSDSVAYRSFAWNNLLVNVTGASYGTSVKVEHNWNVFYGCFDVVSEDNSTVLGSDPLTSSSSPYNAVLTFDTPDTNLTAWIAADIIDSARSAGTNSAGAYVYQTGGGGAQREDYYVDSSASPGGDGTQGDPFDTIADAVSASTNDTIYIHLKYGSTFTETFTAPYNVCYLTAYGDPEDGLPVLSGFSALSGFTNTIDGGAGEWSVIYAEVLDTAQNDADDVNMRLGFTPSHLTGDGDSMRFTIRGTSNGNTLLGGVSAGILGAGGDYASAPVNVTYAGKDTATVLASDSLRCDPFPITFTYTSDTLGIHVWTDNVRNLFRNVASTVTKYQKTGGTQSDESETVDITGYTWSDLIVGISSIEVADNATTDFGDISKITLAGEQADFSVVLGADSALVAVGDTNSVEQGKYYWDGTDLWVADADTTGLRIDSLNYAIDTNEKQNIIIGGSVEQQIEFRGFNKAAIFDDGSGLNVSYCLFDSLFRKIVALGDSPAVFTNITADGTAAADTFEAKASTVTASVLKSIAVLDTTGGNNITYSNLYDSEAIGGTGNTTFDPQLDADSKPDSLRWTEHTSGSKTFYGYAYYPIGTLSITAPDSTMTFTIGTDDSITVTWTQDLVGNIIIAISDSGYYANRDTVDAADGTAKIALPSSATSQGQIKLTSLDDPLVSSEMSGYFTINAATETKKPISLKYTGGKFGGSGTYTKSF